MLLELFYLIFGHKQKVILVTGVAVIFQLYCTKYFR